MVLAKALLLSENAEDSSSESPSSDSKIFSVEVDDSLSQNGANTNKTKNLSSNHKR